MKSLCLGIVEKSRTLQFIVQYFLDLATLHKALPISQAFQPLSVHVPFHCALPCGFQPPVSEAQATAARRLYQDLIAANHESELHMARNTHAALSRPPTPLRVNSKLPGAAQILALAFWNSCSSKRPAPAASQSVFSLRTNFRSGILGPLGRLRID